MRELVIDRRRWLRGEETEVHDSFLLSSETGVKGKMCCLGFYLRSLGMRPKEIRDLAKPSEVGGVPDEASWLLAQKDEFTDDSETCEALITVNDDADLAEQDREREVAALFADHGVNVRFK